MKTLRNRFWRKHTAQTDEAVIYGWSEGIGLNINVKHISFALKIIVRYAQFWFLITFLQCFHDQFPIIIEKTFHILDSILTVIYSAC